MSNFNYESYCGLYCGACSILKAYQTGIRDKFASFWADEAGLDLKCHGCKSDTVFANCSICKIRSCAVEKGVEHCAVCKDFPCSQFDVNEFKNIQDSLPHVKTIQKGLPVLISSGAEEWLASQSKQWQCPDCQTDFSWYADNCSKCGRELTQIKGFSDFDKKIFEALLNLPKE